MPQHLLQLSINGGRLQVSKAEYLQHGSEVLTARLAAQMQAEGKTPYIIPVGGSNSLGCWGYMMALEEIRRQTADTQPFTHIVMVRCFRWP
jgi:D-cysteine desulfhydrase